MLVLALAGCLATPGDSPTEVFEYVWNDFDELYGGFDQRDVDWDAVWDTYHPRVSDDMDDDALFAVLGDMVAETDDGHISITAPDREVFRANVIYRDHLMEGRFDIEVVKSSYLTDVEIGPWDGYVRGLAAPGVPYVWFPWIDDNQYVFDTIADENPDARAMIIDLRHSHGGAFTYVVEGMGRLAEDDVYAWRSRSRNAPERGSFGDWYEWTMEAREPYWGPKLLVLTDGESISATERALLILRELPNVTIIGVRSNGSLATSIGRQAPNGWFYQLPIQEVEGPDGTVWEGAGIPVDIEVLNDPADVEAGIDEMLETALAEVPEG